LRLADVRVEVVEGADGVVEHAQSLSPPSIASDRRDRRCVTCPGRDSNPHVRQDTAF
jgi:hypothetical protein